MLQQVVQRVLEGAREELGREVHRNELRLRVDGLVAGHGGRLDAGRRMLHILCEANASPASRFRFHIGRAGFSYSLVRLLSIT
ncbi:hypothetical protein MASR1M101_12630 [Gemmatimonas sp.]